MPSAITVGPLPIELDEITPDLLNRALSSRFQEPRIQAVRIDESHHGFSTVLRLHLDADDSSHAAGLPKSIMLKGQFEEASKTRGREYTYKSLEWEFRAYDILPGLGLKMPEVFFKELDPERSQMMILMEDLALRDVRFQAGLKPVTARGSAK